MAALPAERERWRIARLFDLWPFDERVLALTDPQMDWLLAQWQLDHPPTQLDEVKNRYRARVEQMHRQMRQP